MPGSDARIRLADYFVGVVNGVIYTSIKNKALRLQNEENLSPIKAWEHDSTSITAYLSDRLIADSSRETLQLVSLPGYEMISELKELFYLMVPIFYVGRQCVFIYRREHSVLAQVYFALWDIDKLEPVWENKAPKATVFYSVSDEYVYVLAGFFGEFSKYELSTGRLVWTKTFKDWELDIYQPNPKYRVEAHGDLFIFQGRALINLNPSRLVAVSCDTGQVEWIVEDVLGREFAVSQEGVVYSMKGSRLNQLDATTGKLLSTHTIDEPISETLSLQLTRTHVWVTYAHNGCHLIAINPETGKVEKKYSVENFISGAPVICNNRLYVCTLNLDIENQDRKDFVIEGEGGYIPD